MSGRGCNSLGPLGHLDRPTSDTLCVRLTGRWRLDERVPSVDEIEHAVTEGRGLRRIVLDASALSDWDTGLVSFVLHVLRRSEERGIEVDREGHRTALLPLLPVLDALERALRAGSTDPEFYNGVAATHAMFIAALREAGAEPIATVGCVFDPAVHEAVSTVVSDALAPGTVAREVRRGWRVGDEVLRPAQVVVAAAGEESGESWP